MTKDLEQDESVQDSAVEAEAPEQTDEEIWNEINDDKSGDGHDEGVEEDPIEEEAEPAEAEEAEPDTDSTEDKDEDADSDDPEKLREQIERLSQQIKSEKGRARSLNMRHEKIQSELKAARSQLEAIKAAELDRPTSEKIRKAREEYGDVLGPVLDRLDKTDAANRRLAEVHQEQERRLRNEQAQYLGEQLNVFKQEHPNGVEFLQKNADHLREWVKDQPFEDRQVYEQNRRAIVDGEAAALLVSKYKASIAPKPDSRPAPTTTSRRQRQIAGAQSVRSSGSQVVTSDGVPSDDDPEALWKYWTRPGR